MDIIQECAMSLTLHAPSYEGEECTGVLHAIIIIYSFCVINGSLHVVLFSCYQSSCLDVFEQPTLISLRFLSPEDVLCVIGDICYCTISVSGSTFKAYLTDLWLVLTYLCLSPLFRLPS